MASVNDKMKKEEKKKKKVKSNANHQEEDKDDAFQEGFAQFLRESAPARPTDFEDTVA